MYNDTNCTALLLRNLKSFPDLLWAKPDALSVKPIPIIKCLKMLIFFIFQSENNSAARENDFAICASPGKQFAFIIF